jgi:hypothetical protein
MTRAALLLTLALAWLNLLLTGKWADLPGALNGPRRPIYAAALLVATVLTFVDWRRLGTPVRLGRLPSSLVAAAGAAILVAVVFSRLPIHTWNQLIFQDDWTELYQQTVNGVHLLRHGSVLGWNWWLMNGYPTSTDIAQNLGVFGLVPMTLFGDRIGYHVLHVAVFLSLPLFVWWDLRQEDGRTAAVAGALAACFVAGYSVALMNSGDTNSLMGVFSAAVALAGSRAARLGRRWGGPVEILGLTLGLYSHDAFTVYAGILLTYEAVYYRDARAFARLAIAGVTAVLASLPMHWESLRYHAYVSFNNTVFDPAAPKDWGLAARTVYYNVEMLAFPHRWFNDYRSVANVWLPVLIVAAVARERSRGGFYAGGAVIAQLLLRLNTSEAGAIFDRIQHLLPLLTAPAFAWFVTARAGTRRLAIALVAVLLSYIATSFTPVRHVPELRAWNPGLVDRIAAADGNAVVVEINPHRDMDTDPDRRTPKTPFEVHYEGLLPGVTGRRFYSQMIDGWAWNVWRGEVVAAGTWQGRTIDDVPIDDFIREMRRWGVRHLFVWADRTRDYLARSGRFSEAWRDGLWSEFAMHDADTRSVVVPRGGAVLEHLDMFGGDVRVADVGAGDPVVIRAHYYPAWRASLDGAGVPLESLDGQLAFRAPRAGSYVVRLAYPRYRGVLLFSLIALVAGAALIQSRPVRSAAPNSY